MQPNRDAFRLVLAGILATVTLALAAQSSNRQEPEALKRADAAFRAGYAAQQAGNLELARAPGGGVAYYTLGDEPAGFLDALAASF